MSEWISVDERLPSNIDKGTGPHIHCWVAIKGKNGYRVEHLAWNPYYLVWDSEDEDDVSHLASQVAYWQLLIIPEPPK